jgi:hypothetical protein
MLNFDTLLSKPMVLSQNRYSETGNLGLGKALPLGQRLPAFRNVNYGAKVKFTVWLPPVIFTGDGDGVCVV